MTKQSKLFRPRMSLLPHILLWTGAGFLMLLGLIGSIVPALPGPPFIFAGALLYAAFTGFARVGWITLAVLLAITAFSQVFDYLASAWGAKKFGGGRWGMAGSILGGIAGFILFDLPGMIAGVFIGAFALELLFGNKEALAALRVGGGSLLGFLGGALMKVIFSLIMIGIFLFDALR
ncbi:MAG: DUF456 domain-containing protein [Candidatus Aureabacteria bacterium]|nr:DUF456 domain-containing protein [Candidatus Auribacterota bacterium]